MYELVCWILCAFGLFQIVFGLCSDKSDRDWEFFKGVILVVIGLMAGFVFKCLALS